MAELILEYIENPEYILVDSLLVINCGKRGFSSTRLSTNSTNLGCGNPIVILVSIRESKSQQLWTPASAMFNSKALTQFIDPEFTDQLVLKLDSKPVPEALIVVDGQQATAPLIHTCALDLMIDQHLETLTFQVTKLVGW